VTGFFDYAVLAVLAFSLIVGVLRGLVRELVMLSGWIAAFLLATAFSDRVARLMPESLGPMVAQLLGFAAVFAGTLVAAAFVGLVLSLLTRSAGLGWTDRSLGACFGAVRGLLVVLAAVLVAGLTPLPQQPFWRNAVLSGPFETAVIALRPFLPGDMARRIKYR
jgi:membrane protein required for colicin V production